MVDVDASIGQILKNGLAMHGVSVRCETRSTVTIEAGREFCPELVLLDVDMPVKDGR